MGVNETNMQRCKQNIESNDIDVEWQAFLCSVELVGMKCLLNYSTFQTANKQHAEWKWAVAGKGIMRNDSFIQTQVY